MSAPRSEILALLVASLAVMATSADPIDRECREGLVARIRALLAREAGR